MGHAGGVAHGAGVGGVNRGPGAAELTWGEETPGRTDLFEAKSLPAARHADPERTAVFSVGATAPNVNPVAEGAGSQDVEGSTGRSAWRRRLSPSHRRAVKTFFGPPQDKTVK